MASSFGAAERCCSSKISRGIFIIVLSFNAEAQRARRFAEKNKLCVPLHPPRLCV
jgi:hypothetical protein